MAYTGERVICRSFCLRKKNRLLCWQPQTPITCHQWHTLIFCNPERISRLVKLNSRCWNELSDDVLKLARQGLVYLVHTYIHSIQIACRESFNQQQGILKLIHISTSVSSCKGFRSASDFLTTTFLSSCYFCCASQTFEQAKWILFNVIFNFFVC